MIVSELIPYCAVNMPEDDTSTLGGAIDTAGRPLDQDLSASSKVAFVSDGADVRTVTVQGRLSGQIQSEAITLTGTTEVVGTKDFDVPLEVTLSAVDASRSVAMREGAGGNTLHVFNPNETYAVYQFRQATSAAAGKTYHEKYFLKNTHPADTLTAGSALETADATGLYTLGIGSVGGTATAANRLTAPGGVTFDNGPQTVPDLAPAQAVEVWYRQSLGADEAQSRDSFDTKITGVAA